MLLVARKGDTCVKGVKSMGENDSTVHSSFWLDVRESATWNVDSLNHECDCPGPPPQFYLPPPPWLDCVSDFKCMDNTISGIEICRTCSVISDEYRYSLTLTPLSVISIVAVAVFLFIGTILVIIRREKVQQLRTRKSTISYCESAIASSSIIYEDMTDIHLRGLTALGSPCQLPSSEMTRISSCTSQNMLICSSSPVPKSHPPKNVFSPVNKEFSYVHNERRETGSEEIFNNFNSEDECAEDELGLEGGVGNYSNTTRGSRNTLLFEIGVTDFLKNLDTAIADDRSRFLESCERNLSPVLYREKEARIIRGVHFNSYDTEKRLKKLHKKRERKDSSFSNLNSCGSRADEVVFLKKLFQCNPNSPEKDFFCSLRTSSN